MAKSLEQYLEQKIEEIDQQKDLNDIIGKGRFSFGMDAATYERLPNWSTLVAKKKRFKRWLWIDAVLLSILIVSVITDVWEKFDENWIKALAGLLLLSLLVLFVFILAAFYNLFFQFRSVDREARKLIYQDILHRLKEEKETITT